MLALFASNLTLSKVEQYVHDWFFNKKLKSLIRRSLIRTALNLARELNCLSIIPPEAGNQKFFRAGEV